MVGIASGTSKDAIVYLREIAGMPERHAASESASLCSRSISHLNGSFPDLLLKYTVNHGIHRKETRILLPFVKNCKA